MARRDLAGGPIQLSHRRSLTVGVGGGPQLSFSGSVILPEDHTGLAFTLVVLGDPTMDYDTFAESSDPDAIATITGADVSISGLDFETKTSHSLSYTADTSPPTDQLTLDITITVTDVAENKTFMVPGYGFATTVTGETFMVPGYGIIGD